MTDLISQLLKKMFNISTTKAFEIFHKGKINEKLINFAKIFAIKMENNFLAYYHDERSGEIKMYF